MVDVESIYYQVREDFDNFIVEVVRPYCENEVHMKISKEILRIALTECKINHPELFTEEEN